MLLAFVMLTLTVMQMPSSKVAGAPEINDATTQGYEDKIADLQAQAQAYRDKINATKNDIASITTSKHYYDGLLSVTEQSMQTAEELIVHLEDKIAEKETEIAEMEKNIASQNDLIIEQLRYAQDQDTYSILEIIFGSGSLSEMLAQMDRISSVLEYNDRVMREYEAQHAELEAAKVTLEEARAAQEEYAKELAAAKEEYETLSDEYQAKLNDLKNDQALYEKYYRETLAAEEKASKELDEYIKKRQQELASQGKDRPVATGPYLWPVNRTYISSYFGYRYIFGSNSFHGGIDIPAPRGTDIWATKDGTVVIADGSERSTYGKYVLLDHGGNVYSLYAHASALCVTVGQEVKQGDVIAKVGTTGRSTGNHLHFEIRVNGSRVNPLDYVSIPS